MAKKETTLTIRITDDMRKQLDELAERKGTTTSDYLRYLIFSEIEKQKAVK